MRLAHAHYKSHERIALSREMAQGPYQSGRRKVLPELGAHYSAVPVSSRDLSPDDPEKGAILLGLPLVDIRQSLSQVPIHLLLGVYAFNLNQRRARVLVRLRSAPHGE